MNLTISKARKSFGKRKILDNTGFTCNTGEITAIFGRNGSGKSTLLKMLFGSMKANSLSIKINNKDWPAKDIIPYQKIAYLPQEPFLPRHYKVRDIIPLYYEGDCQDKMFYADGIHPLLEKTAGSLSMGQNRYLELLLVSNLDHPFIMLDEPFSMIEPLYKEKIKDFLLELKIKKGIILTDHYYTDVLEVSDRNLLLKEGKLITVNTIEELTTHGYLKAVNL